MGGDVQASAGEVEADPRGGLAAKRLLPIDWISPREDRDVRLTARLANLGHQRNQRVAQLGEHGGHLASAGFGLVIVQQGVVGTLGIAQRFGLAAFQFDGFFQQRPKRGEIIVRPGGLPNVLAKDGGPREFLDERLGQIDFLVVFAQKTPNRGAGVGVRVGGQRAAGQFDQPLAPFGVGSPLVNHAGQHGHLFGAMFPPRSPASWCARPSPTATQSSTTARSVGRIDRLDRTEHSRRPA